MKNAKLYFNNRNFFWLRETPKMIFIKWIPHLSNGDELDQNVNYKELKVKKEKAGKHCLKDWTAGDKEFLIYPDRSGIPYFFTPANIEDINREIKDCEAWGVSAKYYKNLRIYTWGNL